MKTLMTLALAASLLMTGAAFAEPPGKVIARFDANSVHIDPNAFPTPRYTTILVIIKDHCFVSSLKGNSKIAATAIDEKDWEITSEMFSQYRVTFLPVGTRVGLVHAGEWSLVHPLGERDYTYWVRKDFLGKQ